MPGACLVWIQVSKKKGKKRLIYTSSCHRSRLFPNPKQTHANPTPTPAKIPETHCLSWKIKALCQSAPVGQRHLTYADPGALPLRTLRPVGLAGQGGVPSLLSGLQSGASLPRFPEEAPVLSPANPDGEWRSQSPVKQLLQVASGHREKGHTLEPRAEPAFQPTCLSGPGLLCSCAGLPRWGITELSLLPGAEGGGG